MTFLQLLAEFPLISMGAMIFAFLLYPSVLPSLLHILCHSFFSYLTFLLLQLFLFFPSMFFLSLPLSAMPSPSLGISFLLLSSCPLEGSIPFQLPTESALKTVWVTAGVSLQRQVADGRERKLGGKRARTGFLRFVSHVICNMGL